MKTSYISTNTLDNEGSGNYNMNGFLLESSLLPDAFEYPALLIGITDIGKIDCKPWDIMDRDRATLMLGELKQKYPLKMLVPFAERYDNNDVACFEQGKGEEVQVIRSCPSQECEQTEYYETFSEWFNAALNDMVNLGWLK